MYPQAGDLIKFKHSDGFDFCVVTLAASLGSSYLKARPFAIDWQNQMVDAEDEFDCHVSSAELVFAEDVIDHYADELGLEKWYDIEEIEAMIREAVEVASMNFAPLAA